MSTNPQAALDWFSQFHEFTYDTTADVTSNFNRLATSRKGGARLRAKWWVKCQNALFGSLYGTDTTKLAKWQSLCAEVGLSGSLPSINKCKKVSMPP